MRRHVPIALVGNALAVMVAATSLARKGADVTLVNGSKNWGGHFAPIVHNGISYDGGMVLHEFTSYNVEGPNADPRSYDPAVRNDAGRFCEVVRNYVGAHQATRDISAPKMYVGGRLYNDILIANALTSLSDLPFAASVARELAELAPQAVSSPIHASRKRDRREFLTATYDVASLANHGGTFHGELIEPFCRKLFNVSTSAMLALYHRVAWLPLFYPETLLSYLEGRPQELPPTVFSYPVDDCVGALSLKLKREIDEARQITAINEHPTRVAITDEGRVELDFANQDGLLADRVAWGNPLTDLLRVLGVQYDAPAYTKSSISILLLRIPTDVLRNAFTVLSVVDADVSMYRITNQSWCAGLDTALSTVVVELNPDYLPASNGEVQSDRIQKVTRELFTLGIVADASKVECTKVIDMRRALLLPSAMNRQTYDQEMRLALNASGPIHFVGPASGFFSSSLNDQIVQGLKLTALWGTAT